MKLNLIQLKKFAIETPLLPEPLRQLIIEEPDHMETAEFITKVGVWLRLLRLANDDGRHAWHASHR